MHGRQFGDPRLPRNRALGRQLPRGGRNRVPSGNPRCAHPTRPLHSDLAYAYEVLGRKDEAYRGIPHRRCLSIRELVEAQNGIARILSDRGDYREARRHFERAQQLDADNPLAYLRLAALCVKTGDFAQGLAYAEHGLELDPRLYACDLAAAQALAAWVAMTTRSVGWKL